ncbi:MAG: substrate binding domain-containing protein, partial [Pseudomonadales bacterium]|nr:substrate binding domain-containing protein [Pseudomonadales bacterium]
HDQLTINIDFSDRQVDLVEEGLDLAFRIAELQDSTLMARKICPINLILCASPDYLREHGTPKSPEDLKDHSLLHYDVSGTTRWKFTGKKGQQHSVNISAKIKANNGDFLRDMAIAGHGIVSSPTFIAWKAIATGDLVPVLTDYTLPRPSAYAVYPQTRYLSQRTRMLIDFLVERFGENPYWDQSMGRE